MTDSGSKVQQFLLKSIVPVFCSILAGFFFYQGDIFSRHHSAFQFLWSGGVASVFYHLLVFLRPRDALLGFLFLLLLTFLTTQSARVAFILRDIFYTGAIGLSIYAYFKYFRPAGPSQYACAAFTLGGIYGITYIIASEIHFAILRAFVLEVTGGTVVSLAMNTAFYGVVIGFAVGFGIGLNEKLSSIKRRL